MKNLMFFPISMKFLFNNLYAINNKFTCHASFNLICPRLLRCMKYSSSLFETNKISTLFDIKSNYDSGHFGQFSTTTNILSKSKDRMKNKSKSQYVDVRELSSVVDVEKLMAQFENEIENLKKNFIKHVSVRTSGGSIEELPIKFDGDEYVLQDLAQIARKPNMIVLDISTFPTAIPHILNSLQKSQMNLNPQQDGTKIFVQIPKVTKEYREQLAKSAKKYFIKTRDNIKNIQNKYIKSIKQDDKIPIDIKIRVQGYLEVLCNKNVTIAESLLEIKQKELLGS